MSIKTLKPLPLSIGDTIAVVAPSRPLEDNEENAIRKVLEELGYRIKFGKNVNHRRGYLAGHDQERAYEFMNAWCDESVKMVWCVGGGYGAGRILEYLDFKKIKNHPKIFVGMSDITALHCALIREANMVTFLGPMLQKLIGNDTQTIQYSKKHLLEMVQGNGKLPIALDFSKTIRPGKARGYLVGGNLALISSLVGTKWQLETEGKILILEDINEEPYRIDRMLLQLKHAGLLSAPAGIVLASWENCQPKRPSFSLSLEEVFHDYFFQASYPVFLGYPSGHIEEQMTLPLNCLVEMDSILRELCLLENPCLTD